MAQNRPIEAWWNVKKDPKWTFGSVPDRLAEKILQNDGDQIGVWMSHVSDGHYFDPALHQKFGLSEKDYIAHRDHPDGPFMYLPAAALLTFCQNIGIHPAQMVPLTDDPRLSLHPTILQALIDLYTGDYSSDNDIALSRAAIDCELRRFERELSQRDARRVAAAQRVVSTLSAATSPKNTQMKLALYYNAAVMGGDECLVAGQDELLAGSFQTVTLLWTKRNRQRWGTEKAFLSLCRAMKIEPHYEQLTKMIDPLIQLVREAMKKGPVVTIESIGDLVTAYFPPKMIDMFEQSIAPKDQLYFLAKCLQDYVLTDGRYCMEKNRFLYRLEEVPDAIDNVYDGQCDTRRQAHHIRLIVNQMVLDDNAEYLKDIVHPQTVNPLVNPLMPRMWLFV